MIKPMDFEILTEERLIVNARLLAAGDPHLAEVLQALGPPPLWSREPGFPTLLYIILEQQVSLASARAAFSRLVTALGSITPEAFLTLSDLELKAIGFSRQKAAYGRNLAQVILSGDLDLAALPALDDESVRAELIRLKGIGRWTADIYLMEALLRPDVWPVGDLALAAAVQRVKRLEELPDPVELAELGDRYRPYRAVAARMFWHHYLSTPRPKNSQKSGKDDKGG